MFGKNGPTLIELLHQALCSTRRGYDLLAPKFDATPFRTPDEILAPALAAVGSVDAALDLCCGTGAAMRLLRPYCHRRLVGLDFSPGMLAQARARLGPDEGQVEPELIEPELIEADPIEVELIEADMFHTHFDAEFDLVTCFGALGHVQPGDEREFVRLVRSALEPGGRFVFVTGYPPPILSVSGLVLRTFNAVMHLRNRLLKPPFIMYYLTFVLPGVQVLLSEEGFDVEVQANLFPAPFSRYLLVVATRR
jgi:SAM-dependent methyltransferase